MPLDCTYRATFGRCEPELLARDELEALRSALADAIAWKEATHQPFRCDLPDSRRDWAPCWGAAAALVGVSGEWSGWRFACERHVEIVEREGGSVIRIVPERVG